MESKRQNARFFGRGKRDGRRGGTFGWGRKWTGGKGERRGPLLQQVRTAKDLGRSHMRNQIYEQIIRSIPDSSTTSTSFIIRSKHASRHTPHAPTPPAALSFNISATIRSNPFAFQADVSFILSSSCARPDFSLAVIPRNEPWNLIATHGRKLCITLHRPHTGS